MNVGSSTLGIAPARQGSVAPRTLDEIVSSFVEIRLCADFVRLALAEQSVLALRLGLGF
jgi:hypothetical protein